MCTRTPSRPLADSWNGREWGETPTNPGKKTGAHFKELSRDHSSFPVMEIIWSEVNPVRARTMFQKETRMKSKANRELAEQGLKPKLKDQNELQVIYFPTGTNTTLFKEK